MKKILTTVLISLISIFSYAQKIVIDEMQNDLRVVETSAIVARNFTDTKVYIFGLRGYSYNTEDVDYILIIRINGFSNISENSKKVLIKTFNNNVLNLSTLSSSNNKYNLQVIGNHIYNLDYCIFYVPISENDIITLKSGLKKLRIELDSGYIDKEYKKDKVGEKLYNSYLLIKNQFKYIKAPTLESNF